MNAMIKIVKLGLKIEIAGFMRNSINSILL